MFGAIMLASVGPAFLEPIIGNDHFREQMEYLHQAGETHTVLVLEVQRLLLQWYEAGDYGLGRGITAMPSMHVALRSEEHTSELQSLMRISDAVFCLKKQNKNRQK